MLLFVLGMAIMWVAYRQYKRAQRYRMINRTITWIYVTIFLWGVRTYCLTQSTSSKQCSHRPSSGHSMLSHSLLHPTTCSILCCPSTTSLLPTWPYSWHRTQCFWWLITGNCDITSGLLTSSAFSNSRAQTKYEVKADLTYLNINTSKTNTTALKYLNHTWLFDWCYLSYSSSYFWPSKLKPYRPR